MEFDKFGVAQEEILAQLEAVRGGLFSDRELEAARRAVSSSLRSALDSQGGWRTTGPHRLCPAGRWRGRTR